MLSTSYTTTKEAHNMSQSTLPFEELLWTLLTRLTTVATVNQGGVQGTWASWLMPKLFLYGLQWWVKLLMVEKELWYCVWVWCVRGWQMRVGKGRQLEWMRRWWRRLGARLRGVCGIRRGKGRGNHGQFWWGFYWCSFFFLLVVRHF